jgi:hypothetical protein
MFLVRALSTKMLVGVAFTVVSLAGTAHAQSTHAPLADRTHSAPAFLRFAHRAAITLSSKEPRLVRSPPNQDQLDHPFGQPPQREQGSRASGS